MITIDQIRHGPMTGYWTAIERDDKTAKIIQYLCTSKNREDLVILARHKFPNLVLAIREAVQKSLSECG